jgi:ATP-binding cassette, subfamily B, vacuolar membrane transporter HMT1/ACLQ
MLIIAHRLSTITDADQILVMQGGSVVEVGTHRELIEKGGRYASMWRKQSRAQKAAVEAEELRTRAKKTLEAAEADSASVSEDEGETVKGRKGEAGSPRRNGRGHKKVNFSQSSLGTSHLAYGNGEADDDPSAGGAHRHGHP